MIGPYQLLVKDACAGMNSIFALSAIGFLYVYVRGHTSNLLNLALQEVQDNDGATNSSVTDASQSAQVLVDAIVAAGGPTYVYVDVPPVDDTSGGQPGGSIRPGFLYNPDVVQYVAGSARVLRDASDLTPSGADDGAFLNSRKPLVAEFIFQGETFTFVNNHFNSKGGDQPLFGANQPPVLNSEIQRIQQAAIVNAFVDAELAADPDANVIVMGDLNDFAWSNPLTTLDGSFGGGTQVLFNLANELIASPAERYSYVFDGNSQELDHVYLTKALLDDFRPQFDIVHVNAEFANQASDHDPSVVALSVNDPLNRITRGDGNDIIYGTAVGDRILAGAGDDAVDGREGDDVLDGGAGNDRLRGDAGNDSIFGGAGNDTLIGFTGDDVLYGQAGDDTLLGEMGDDYLNGGLGDDLLNSGVGNDVMIGGAGNDTLLNSRGNDRMEGGRGNDLVVGAVPDSDVFVFRAGDGQDRFRNFFSNDVIELDDSLAASFAAVLAKATQVGNDVVISFDAQTSITLEAVRLSRLQADDFQFV